MQPPVSPEKVHKDACSADDVTIKHWRETWIRNIKSNFKDFGPFSEKSVGKLFGSSKGAPCIIAGAGPSLKRNAHLLKSRPKEMILVSCLHNFHFMEDLEADVDYYVTLDAGPVTIDEVTEGGTKTEEEYWALTEKRTLIAYIGTDPRLLSKWQGEILFYNAPVPDKAYLEEISGLTEPFHIYVESGGSVLGTCLFFAKGILGSQVSIFIGADFSFSNGEKKQFHSWDSKYDANIGQCVGAVDVFGNRCITWPSYYNFKQWGDVVAQRVPGIYINATEGGILGAYRDGNLINIKQMFLEEVFETFGLHSHKENQCMHPEVCDNKVYI